MMRVVNIGQIYIQDTGYIKPTNIGEQASSGNMANSGNVISINTAEFTPNLTRNINNNPELGSNTPSEVNLGSLENMKFSLTCGLNSNSSTDMDKIQSLLDLVATNGYKLMWYQYTSATPEKNNGKLIYQIAINSKFGHQLTDGEKSKFSISDNFYHLHVHFFGIQPRQSAKSNHVIYTLQGIILKVEPSLIT